MIYIGVILGLVIFFYIAYAIYCSTQCDCVDLRDWEEQFVELTPAEREMLTRPLT